MASLTGNLISNSYQGLLKTSDNGVIASNVKMITDGAGNSTALGLSTNTVEVSGSLQVTGSLIVDSFPDGTVATLLPQSLVVGNTDTTIGVYTDMHGIELYSGSNYLDITVDGIGFNDNVAGTLLAVPDNTGNPHVIVQMQNHDNWTNGNIDINVPLTLHSGSAVTGSLKVASSLVMAPSSSFVLPTVQPNTPALGTAFFSGSFLYIYNGAAFVSASLH